MKPPPRPPNSRRPIRPATSEPPIPTRMVSPIDMGSRPGIARRPSAPTIRPVMTSRMMNVSMRAPYPNRADLSPPLGREVDWSPAQPLQPVVLNGARVSLRPVAIEDAEALFEAGRDPGIWTYLPYGPYSHVDEMRSRVAEMQAATDTLFFAIWVDGIPQGIASYLRID